MRRRWSRGGAAKLNGILRMVLPKQAEEKLALPDIRAVFAEIVGSALASKTFVEDLDEGVLLVKASTPAAAKMISMRGGTLARELSKRTGFPIESLKVVPGRASKRPSGGRRAEPTKVSPPKEDVERNFEEVRGKFTPEREQLALRLASLKALFQKRFPNR